MRWGAGSQTPRERVNGENTRLQLRRKFCQLRLIAVSVISENEKLTHTAESQRELQAHRRVKGSRRRSGKVCTALGSRGDFSPGATDSAPPKTLIWAAADRQQPLTQLHPQLLTSAVRSSCCCAQSAGSCWGQLRRASCRSWGHG